MPRRLPFSSLPVLMLALLTFLFLLASVQAGNEVLSSVPPGQVEASGVQSTDCQALKARLDEQNQKLSQELRQIKREIAALNQNLEKPGLKEVMAGIGYILGLFGVAAFAAARRRDRTSEEA